VHLDAGREVVRSLCARSLGVTDSMDKHSFRITTPLDALETSFFDPGLLTTEYVKALRETYDDVQGTPFFNPHRSYVKLLMCLNAIAAYESKHARAYAKRLKHQEHDFRSCEAVFAETIVYAWYVPLVYEGVIAQLDLLESECDLIIKRSDGREAFLEVLSVMPDMTPGSDGLVDIGTHTQARMSSVRQKILNKMRKQEQMVAPRENWAVVELNSTALVGDFAILSSLSGGYKIPVDKSTLEFGSGQYDWRESIFNEPEAVNVRGVIYFNLGDYGNRRVVLNPCYEETVDDGNGSDA